MSIGIEKSVLPANGGEEALDYYRVYGACADAHVLLFASLHGGDSVGGSGR